MKQKNLQHCPGHTLLHNDTFTSESISVLKKAPWRWGSFCWKPLSYQQQFLGCLGMTPGSVVRSLQRIWNLDGSGATGGHADGCFSLYFGFHLPGNETGGGGDNSAKSKSDGNVKPRDLTYHRPVKPQRDCWCNPVKKHLYQCLSSWEMGICAR